MALRLKLKPQERVIISGAVVRNGDSRAELLIENQVPILREPDILSPSDARTPCEMIYLALQLMYVNPVRANESLAEFRALALDVLDAAPSSRRYIERIEESVADGELYCALKNARSLLDYERELMKHVQ